MGFINLTDIAWFVPPFLIGTPQSHPQNPLEWGEWKNFPDNVDNEIMWMID